MLVVGVESSSRDVGGIVGMRPTVAAHGGRPEDQRINVDGFSSGAVISQASSNLVPNPEFAQEVVVETTAQGAEIQTGGVTVDFVPRDGGNAMSGSLFAWATSGQDAGEESEPIARGPGSDSARAAREILGSQSRCGRADRPQSTVVLWQFPHDADADQNQSVL
jgi:hypothetical protein